MNELRAFAAGRWSEFSGLASCSVSMADTELGPPLEAALHGGVFGGEPTQYRRYPSTAVAPGGVTAWVLGDLLVGLELREPVPPEPAMSALGRPGAVISSELGGTWTQQLWPERGLVLHCREVEDGERNRIAVVFGLAPFDLAAWASDPLRWWRIERRQRRS